VSGRNHEKKIKIFHLPKVTGKKGKKYAFERFYLTIRFILLPLMYRSSKL
jgi:hypothetical protein